MSGFALRRDDAGAEELLAASDDDWSMLRVPIDVDGSLGAVRREELWRHLPALIGKDDGSDVECLAADGTGRVLLVQEALERVLVLAPDLETLEGVIELVVDPSDAGVGSEWSADSVGEHKAEGVVLLKDGHILVAKQEDPVRFIEFGPASDAALGAMPASILGRDEAFAAPAWANGRARYSVLGSWGLGMQERDRFRSVNDLAVDGHGRIHVVSSASHRVGRLAPISPADELARLEARWKLPALRQQGDPRPALGEAARGERRAEALAILADGSVLVGVDTKLTGDNVFAFDGLD